ncbi:MAG: phosphoribosyltransferase [Candidatus Nitrohelix vancouverensis]|uniref:Phosphoribosyltransferase n=1 Tax=Candidatus Nitrohelix vancouverensis TaxID=2705534 RepID=A0A7T0G339_9BACT|nr:MAG: phosphoribosyltransferase [Candidatus Nitrohelix vancouverensis]
MFSRIKKEGQFVLSNGVKSEYDYDYASLTDDMSAAYCELLRHKLEAWQADHGRFNVIIGIETEGIRIAYQLSRAMGIPFYVVSHNRLAFAQMKLPAFSADTHFLIVDDIVTTGSSFVRAVNFLEIEEKPDTVTFACMIRRDPKNLDYSAVQGDLNKEQFNVPDERFDFIDKRLVSLYCE